MRGMILAVALSAFAAGAKSLLVLPIAGDSTKAGDLKTLSRVYREALAVHYPGRILTMPDMALPCRERNCALEAAKNAGADEVIHSSLNRLGSKWVFSSTFLNAGSGEAFNQHLAALSMEDMEAVAKRMADALLARKTIDQVATLDNVTELETREAPKRRRSFYSSGVSFGYLWPVGKSFGYLETDRSEFPYSYRLKTRSRISHFSWMNSWELRNNMLVNFDFGLEFLDKAPVVGGDFNLDYLLGRQDITPFLGGGLGLHYVPPDVDAPADKRNSGPTLNAEGGLMLFRTYDVHVLLRGQYRIVFNSDIDNGFVTDVAVTYKVKQIKDEVNWKREGNYALFGLVGLGLMLLIAAL